MKGLITWCVVTLLEFVWNGAVRQSRVMTASGPLGFRKHPSTPNYHEGAIAGSSYFCCSALSSASFTSIPQRGQGKLRPEAFHQVNTVGP